ncbi:unnamed protein product, partial [Meganyctiphanes norvegica]
GNEFIELDLSKLRTTSKLPCDYRMPGQGFLVAIIDPFNRTKDTNWTNNFAMGPIEYECGYSNMENYVPGCDVMPDGVDAGLSATILSRDQEMPKGYYYEAESGGFRPLEVEEASEKFSSHQLISETATRLKALDRCESSDDDGASAMKESVLTKASDLLTTLYKSAQDIKPEGTNATADNTKILALMKAAESALSTAMAEDGEYRQMLLFMMTRPLAMPAVTMLIQRFAMANGGGGGGGVMGGMFGMQGGGGVGG